MMSDLHSHSVTASLYKYTTSLHTHLLAPSPPKTLSPSQTDAVARDRYLKGAQKYVSAHMAQHGDPRTKMLAIPVVLVGSGAMFISIFNGVRSLMSSGVRALLCFTECLLRLARDL